MTYSETDKLQQEVEKLMLEVQALKRPYLSQPTSWFTVIGLVLSVFVNFSQCSDSKQTKLLADIELAQAKLDADRYTVLGDSLKRAKIVLQLQHDTLQSRIESGNKQFAQLQQRIAEVHDLAARLDKMDNTAPAQNQQVITELRTSLQNISTLNQKAAKDFKSAGYFVKNDDKNLQVAKDKEREGFKLLLSDDLEGARAAFRDAENAYNGYHMVYDLAKLLNQRGKEAAADPAKRKELYQLIVAQYSYGAPDDLLAALKQKAFE